MPVPGLLEPDELDEGVGQDRDQEGLRGRTDPPTSASPALLPHPSPPPLSSGRDQASTNGQNESQHLAPPPTFVEDDHARLGLGPLDRGPNGWSMAVALTLNVFRRAWHGTLNVSGSSEGLRARREAEDRMEQDTRELLQRLAQLLLTGPLELTQSRLGEIVRNDEQEP